MITKQEAQIAETKIGLMRGAIDRQGEEIERLRSVLGRITKGNRRCSTPRALFA